MPQGRTTAFLRQPRPCRVCGTVFRPERWDALTCSSTCRSRRARGHDLQYLAGLSEAALDQHRRQHADVATAIEVLKEYKVAERQGRSASDAAKDAYRAVLMHFESEVIERLGVNRGIPSPEVIMDAINQVIPNCPAEFASQLKFVVLDTFVTAHRRGRARPPIITFKDDKTK
jgi:hypothetical protein